MGNVYTPGAGFAQSTYVDQMATALPGSLAFASDINLVDAAIVDAAAPASGLIAGIGIVLSPIPVAKQGGNRPGMNQFYASLPTASSAAIDFGGILVRNQQMDSNSDGDACWFAGRACNVLRSERVGGRVWVRLVNGSAAVGGTLYWIVSDTTDHGFPIGSFSASAITKDSKTDTIALSGPAFCSVADASGGATIALVELGI